jgi:hypothetical protein
VRPVHLDNRSLVRKSCYINAVSKDRVFVGRTRVFARMIDGLIKQIQKYIVDSVLKRADLLRLGFHQDQQWQSWLARLYARQPQFAW